MGRYGTLAFMGLGLVPAESRRVRPMPASMKGLVPMPTDNLTTVKSSVPDTEKDTMPLIISKAKRTTWQTSQLANKLKGSTLPETLRNDSNFILDYIKYEKDSPNHEQVRSPRRLIHEGVGDCDCFAVALATILRNQGISFKFRIAKYKAGSDWSHIYIVVPKNQKSSSPLNSRDEYYVLDPVTNQHDHEVSYADKKDYSMSSSLQYVDSPVKGKLNGLQYLDGCGPAATVVTNADGSTTTTQSVPTKRPTFDPIPVKTLINRGFSPTEKILTDNAIPFTQNEDGTFTIAMSDGNKLLPSMLSPEQVNSTVTQIATDQTKVARAQQPAQASKNGGIWLVGLGLAAGILFFGSSSSGSLKGLPKKKLSVIKI